MKAKGKFSSLPYVTCGVFYAYTTEGENGAVKFLSEWRADKTVVARAFKRSVRAGGTTCHVTMIVVRRKAGIPPA